MIDLSTQTIQQLFEQQVRELTKRTLPPKEEMFGYQFRGGWIK
jgi:hypothetical protein